MGNQSPGTAKERSHELNAKGGLLKMKINIDYEKGA
jgi:hypothetical protein